MSAMGALPMLADLPSLEEAATAVGSATSTVASAAANVATGGFFSNLPRLVTIALGLLLVGAGLFMMEKTRGILIEGAKGVAEGAASAAV